MTKGKIKKMKTTKIYLFLLPPLPSQNGGVVAGPPPPPPTSQLFFMAKIFETFFIDTLVSGQRVGKWPVWQSLQKRKNGTRKNPKGGGELQQTPLLRERIKVNHDAALRSSKVFHPKLLIIVVTL